MKDTEEDTAPPTRVLRCEHCHAEEPAPIDLVVGDFVDCAYCGEPAEVEMS